jgi:ACS family glucarate transporter-like MFS transporter
MKGIRWLVLFIVVFAAAVSYVLRTNLSIVSETMMHDLGMNNSQLGLVFSAFAAGYAIFQFPGGIFGDKFGARFAITAIAVVWAILTIVTAVIPGTDVLSVGAIVGCLVVTRFLVGAVHAPIFPATTGTVSSWFPVKEWGIANGLSVTVLALGAAATAPLVVWAMESFGWRFAMAITAPTGLILAFVFHRYITDDPQDHPRIRKAELSLIASDRPPTGVGSVKGVWRLALKDRNILLLTISYFCMNYVYYLFFSWFFFYLVDVKGFSAADAGMLTAAMWFIGAIGGVVGGLTCDFMVRHFGMRLGTRYLNVSGLLLTAAFLFLGATADNTTFVIVMLCISFGFTMVTDIPYWVAAMSVAGEHAPVATGILNTGGNVPGILGGMLVPLLANLAGWPVAMASGSVFAIVAAVLWFYIRADEPMGVDAALE